MKVIIIDKNCRSTCDEIKNCLFCSNCITVETEDGTVLYCMVHYKIITDDENCCNNYR